MLIIINRIINNEIIIQISIKVVANSISRLVYFAFLILLDGKNDIVKPLLANL